MHGHARVVEHKIRVWIVQQERERRKERPQARAGAPRELPVEPRARKSSQRKQLRW